MYVRSGAKHTACLVLIWILQACGWGVSIEAQHQSICSTNQLGPTQEQVLQDRFRDDGKRTAHRSMRVDLPILQSLAWGSASTTTSIYTGRGK